MSNTQFDFRCSLVNGNGTIAKSKTKQTQKEIALTRNHCHSWHFLTLIIINSFHYHFALIKKFLKACLTFLMNPRVEL